MKKEFDRPGIRIFRHGSKPIRCCECKSTPFEGQAFVVDTTGAIVCDLHKKEFYNGTVRSLIYTRIVNRGSLDEFHKGMVEDVRKHISSIWDPE